MLKEALISSLKTYKKAISPYITKSCRFYPSCSEYAAQAIDKKGILRGIFLSCWRIIRCNPLSKGGYDPVIKNEK